MRCIECEEIELARVHDARPSQMLPIPHAALEGLAGRSSTELTRRRLMQWGVAGFASVYGAKELGFEQVWESVAQAAESATGKNAVVMLYLAGGNDGLNVVLPSGGADYDYYASVRANLKRLQGPNAGGRMGSMQLPGPGSALAFANA